MASFLIGPPTVIGALLSIATISLQLLASKAQSEQFAAVFLACMGAIYAGFGLQTGTRPRIVMELTVVLRYFGAGLAGL
jgi:hypothetical protein